jgi:hypothetical protein
MSKADGLGVLGKFMASPGIVIAPAWLLLISGAVISDSVHWIWFVVLGIFTVVYCALARVGDKKPGP